MTSLRNSTFTIKWAVVNRNTGKICFYAFPYTRVSLIFERRQDARECIRISQTMDYQRVVKVWVEVPTIGGLKN